MYNNINPYEYEMNYRHRRQHPVAGVISAVPAILIGLMLMFFGSPIIFYYDNVETTATVIEKRQVDGEVVPILKYEVNGKSYEEEGFYGDEDEEIGSEVLINYDPENPSDFNIGDKSGFLMIEIIGILLVAFSIFNIVRFIKYMKTFLNKSNTRDNVMTTTSTPNDVEPNEINLIYNNQTESNNVIDLNGYNSNETTINNVIDLNDNQNQEENKKSNNINI